MRISLIAGMMAGAAAFAAGAAPAATGGRLRAGAAKVEITPPAAALKPGDTIRDPLYVRAIVARAGDGCAVLVGIDQGGAREQMVQGALARAVQATRCAPEDFLISATHTHSGSTGGLGGNGEPAADRIADAIVEAVRRADRTLRPARIGYGTGTVDLNVNRDVFEQNNWVQGPNPQGVSDKTLATVALLDDKGLPIGVYMNYAMHPVMFYLSGVVSADFPGEASRYVERRYGDDMVAIFAQGASGDQNPRMQRPYNRLLAVRTGNPGADDISLTAPRPWLRNVGQRNGVAAATSAAGQPLPAARRAVYEAAIRDNGELVTAMGAIIGETAIDTMRFGLSRLADRVTIDAAQETFQCPGRDRQDRDNPIREGALPPYADGAPVQIREGMLRIGDIHLASVNGEVYNGIATRLKRESPAAKLIVTTLANGSANSGYIYSNDAGSHLTFQVIGSRLKPGCAEDRIVETGLGLIGKVDR